MNHYLMTNRFFSVVKLCDLTYPVMSVAVSQNL